MGAWIEILVLNGTRSDYLSHPTMGAWIEIHNLQWAIQCRVQSHPTMGAWIEIALITF